MHRSLLTFSSFRRPFCQLNTQLWNAAKRELFDKEQLMKEKLKSRFPKAENIEIVDISGGCGAMYEVIVVSGDFKGLSIVKQHRLVNEALQDEIKDMHGLRIHTSVPQISKTQI